MALDECLDCFIKAKPHHNAIYLVASFIFACVWFLAILCLIEKLHIHLLSLPLIALSILPMTVCTLNAFLLCAKVSGNQVAATPPNIEVIENPRAWQFETSNNALSFST